MAFTGVISANTRTANMRSSVRYVGIQSIEQTVVSEENGGVNVLTIALTNGDVQTFEVRNGTAQNRVEAAVRRFADVSTGSTPFEERLMVAAVGFGFLAKGENDAIRIDSVGMLSEGVGAVRFGLYEVLRGEDGTGGTLRLAEDLGNVEMASDGMARLDLDGGLYTELNEVAIVALSDRAMLQGANMNGVVLSNVPIIEDGDYTGETEIPFQVGQYGILPGWLLDYSVVNFMGLDDLASDTAQRLLDLEGRAVIPSALLTPTGYVLTKTDNGIEWKPASKEIEVDATLEKSGMAADSKTVGDRLAVAENHIADLLYEPITIDSFGHNAGTRELGEVVEAVVLNWGTNKTPVTLELNGEAVDATLTSKKLEGLSITEDTSWTLTATDERDATASKTTSIRFLNGVYYGAAAAPEAVDSAFILGLTKTLTSTRKRTVTVDAGQGEYIWYAVPARLGKCTFKVGGFEGGFDLVAEQDFTNALGYTEPYYIYRSGQTGLGSTTVEVS